MEQQKKKYHWGILSCGKIAHKFAQDLITTPNVVLYAMASRNLKKATNFGKKYKVSNYYGSYKQLVTDSKTDVIYIPTPHVFHYEHTLMCLHHKKAVLCESLLL